MFEIFLLATAVLSTGASILQQKKSASAQKRARQAEQRAQNLRAAKERRESIRQARMAYARAQVAGANQGVYDSSGSIGGLGSIISQQNSNVSFLDGQMQLANYAGSQMDKAYKHEANAGMWSAVAGLSLAGLQYQQSKPATPKDVTIPKVVTPGGTPASPFSSFQGMPIHPKLSQGFFS